MAIQFAADGVTLFYIDGTGQRVAHNFMDGAAYNAMLTVMDAQLQAARDNTQTAGTYERQATEAEAAHVMVQIPKPLMKVVSDTGVVSYAPFVPPLRDMAISNAAPSGSIATQAPSADHQQAVMYNMVLAMFRKMFPEAQ